MPFRISFLFLLLIFISQTVFSQDTFHISGVVKDSKGVTLPGASVLLSGYQKGTVADNNGEFTISKLSSGSYDVLVQLIGYFAISKNVKIEDKSISIEVILEENQQLLDEVVIRPDPKRGEYLRIFREYFIGTSPNSKSCRIVNPQIINFDHDEAKRMLTANTREFLIIENRSLGYRIKYLLNHFQINDERTRVSYYGFPSYEELDKSKPERFRKPRELAYKGSAQHFFRSLLQNSLQKEGFLLNKLLLGIKNYEKAPDSLIQDKLIFFDQTDNKNFVSHGADSLEYWQEMNRKPYFIDFLDKNPVLVDTLLKNEINGIKSMNFENGLYVSYKGKSESFYYKSKSAYRITKPYEYRNYQASVIKQLRGPIRFFKNGNIEDPQSLLYEGYWSYEKMGDAMPLDYTPVKKGLH